MKRGPGNKKDDASFKTLLARLDGGLDQAHTSAPALPIVLSKVRSAPASRSRRGIRRAGLAGGVTILAIASVLAYPWIGGTRPGPSARDDAGRVVGSPTSTALAASLVPGGGSEAITRISTPNAPPPLAPPRTVRTQAVPVQAQTGTPGPAASEPDGPPVPLVARPNRAPELERPNDAAPRAPAGTAPDVKDIKLLVAPSQRARAGERTPLAVKVDAAGQPVEGLRVAISGLASGTTLSSGGPKSAGLWHVPVRGIEQLLLLVPAMAGDDMILALELQDAAGHSLARASTQIIVLPAPPAPPMPAQPVVSAPPPAPSPPAAAGMVPAGPTPATPSVTATPAPPRLSMDEHTALIERGRLLARNGDIAGARLLFERAADTGSGRAALLLGETYDPDVLAGMGVLGAKGDFAKARRWYAKANELGIPIAAERLKALAGK